MMSSCGTYPTGRAGVAVVPTAYLDVPAELFDTSVAVLSGSRKQLFITFAPWVLVTIFKQPTQFIATLMTATIAGVLTNLGA